MNKKIILILICIFILFSNIIIIYADEKIDTNLFLTHTHIYVNDKCIKCGSKRWNYEKSGIPLLYYAIDAPKQGKSITIKYKNNDKLQGQEVSVYLPYGYTNTNKYNVVFLVPGSNGTINTWMNDSLDMDNGTITGKRLFDWLIYTHQSAPFIAVSIPMQPDSNGLYNSSYSNYVNSIKNYWLPMIINGIGVYSKNGEQIEIEFGGTYAKSSNESDIELAKSHFMIVGVSQGATFVSNYAVDPNSDLGKRFGNKVIMSSFIPDTVIENNYNKDNNQDILYFISGGKLDTTKNGSPYKIMSNYIINKTLKQFTFYEFNSGHKWYTWFRGIATVMQYAMK